MNLENTTVGITFTQKFNLGNYESAELSVTFYARSEQNEPIEGVTEFLLEKAKESVYRQAKKVTDAHDVTCPSIQKYYMGKKIDRLPSEANKPKSVISLAQLNGDMANETINYDPDYGFNEDPDEFYSRSF